MDCSEMVKVFIFRHPRPDNIHLHPQDVVGGSVAVPPLQIEGF